MSRIRPLGSHFIGLRPNAGDLKTSRASTGAEDMWAFGCNMVEVGFFLFFYLRNNGSEYIFPKVFGTYLVCLAGGLPGVHT